MAIYAHRPATGKRNIDKWRRSPLAMVKELRDKTGAGMMDCKQALSETSGEMEAAVDWLRKKGLSKAAKKAGRVAAEGLIGIALAGTKGAMVEVNSETDFVARNEQFQGLVKMVAQVAPGRRQRRREDQGREGWQRHRRDRDCGRDRDHRREHVAAPRRDAFGQRRRGCELRAQRRHRRPGADRRAGCAGEPGQDRTNCRRSAARSRCTLPRRTRWRSIRRASIRP